MPGTTLDWFPLYAETFLASRANAIMTNEQFGMYLRLLMREWVDGPLPTDTQALLRLCSGNAQALPDVLVWFRETPEGYVNDRLEELRKDAEDRIQAASDKGKKGAKSRWGNRKHNNAQALPKQCVGMTQAMPSDGSIHLPLHLPQNPPTPQGGTAGEAPPAVVKLKTETDPIPYQEIMAYLNERTGSSYRPGTAAHQRFIKARWNDGHRLEDFKRVIDAKAAEWKGTEQGKYLRPETLFGTKFDSYLQQSRSGNGGVKIPREMYGSLEFELSEGGRQAALDWIDTQKPEYREGLTKALKGMP